MSFQRSASLNKTQVPDVRALRVEEIMISEVHSVTMSTTVRHAIKLLLLKKISGAPIVDGVDHVLSVISESDLIKFAALGGLDKQLGEFESKLVSKSELVSVRKEDLFRDVFKQFITKPVRRVIVVDSDGKLQGLVSRSNILKAFLSG